MVHEVCVASHDTLAAASSTTTAAPRWLQAATTSGKPGLLRVDYEGGHFGDPTHDAGLELATDQICFDLWQLGAFAFQRH